MNKKMDKSSLIILIVVGVIVLAVAGYGIWQAVGTGKGGEETSSNASTVSDTVELNDENIKGIWERTDGTTVYRLTFLDTQKLTYEKFENGSDTAALTSTDGSYEISGNKVTISVTADGDTVTETCEAVLSKDGLVLKATSEQSGFFAGDYKRSEQQEVPSSAPESSSSKPESTAPPESTASSEPKPESKPESKPVLGYELSKDICEILNMTLSELYNGSIPEPEGYYQTIAIYSVPGYPTATVCYQIEDGANGLPYMVSVSMEYLIPGVSSCTYQELKTILGDRIGELSYGEMTSTYTANASIDGYSLLFETDSPPPDGKFTHFTIFPR